MYGRELFTHAALACGAKASATAFVRSDTKQGTNLNSPSNTCEKVRPGLMHFADVSSNYRTKRKSTAMESKTNGKQAGWMGYTTLEHTHLSFSFLVLRLFGGELAEHLQSLPHQLLRHDLQHLCSSAVQHLHRHASCLEAATVQYTQRVTASGPRTKESKATASFTPSKYGQVDLQSNDTMMT